MDGNGSAGDLTQVDEALSGGAARMVEVTARCRDGHTFPAEIRVGLLEFLVERGCPLGQGFLFGRPLPAEDIALV